MKKIIFLFILVLASTFVAAESNPLYEMLEQDEGTVLPKPLSSIYSNEKINILIEDQNLEFFIEIKEGTIVEISNAVKDDYTLDVWVKSTQVVASIINSENKIKQFNKARADKEIVISPRGLVSNVKWFFAKLFMKFA